MFGRCSFFGDGFFRKMLLHYANSINCMILVFTGYSYTCATSHVLNLDGICVVCYIVFQVTLLSVIVA